MKTALFACLGTFILGAAPATAQVAIPATPKKFTTRGAGTGISKFGATTTGGTINLGPTSPAPTGKIRYTTHIALSEPRQWQSNDGKSLLGKLIAFEDMAMETEKGAPPPTFTPPANPTVTKDGKARLLVNMKPYELPLDRLSEADRDFIEKIRAAASTAPTPPPQTNAAGK